MTPSWVRSLEIRCEVTISLVFIDWLATFFDSIQGYSLQTINCSGMLKWQTHKQSLVQHRSLFSPFTKHLFWYILRTTVECTVTRSSDWVHSESPCLPTISPSIWQRVSICVLYRLSKLYNYNTTLHHYCPKKNWCRIKN